MLIFQSTKNTKFFYIAYVGFLEFAKFDFLHYGGSFEFQCQELWWAIRIGGPARGLIVGTVDENISEKHSNIVKSNCKNTHSIFGSDSCAVDNNYEMQLCRHFIMGGTHTHTRIHDTYIYQVPIHMHFTTMQSRCEGVCVWVAIQDYTATVEGRTQTQLTQANSLENNWSNGVSRNLDAPRG